MKALSDTLPAVKSKTDLQRTAQAGSTTTDLKPIIPFDRAISLTTPELEHRLQALLKSLSTLQTTTKQIAIYHPTDGYIGTKTEIKIEQISETDKAKLLPTLYAFLIPASPEFILAELTRLRSLTASPQQDALDMKVRIASFTHELQKYPAHAIRFAVDELKLGGWFPNKIIDFMQICDARVRLTQSLLLQLEQNEFKLIDHKPAIHYKQIDESEYTFEHWKQKFDDWLFLADHYRKLESIDDELKHRIDARALAVTIAGICPDKPMLDWDDARLAYLEAEVRSRTEEP